MNCDGRNRVCDGDFPSSRWFTAEFEALRVRNHLEFITLAESHTQPAPRKAEEHAMCLATLDKGIPGPI
jgi:hypothetical protein